jgi:cytochrome c553
MKKSPSRWAILTLAMATPIAIAQSTPAPTGPAPAATAAQSAPAPGQGAPAAAQSAPAGASGGAAGDPAKGREKTRMCQGCHGIDGWRTAYPEVYHVPRLGGQHEAYLAKALHEYKSGERTHPSMRGQVAVLSDQDIADLAAYYAKSDVATATK